MIFLLDTDTCSAHMRRPARLAHRFIQYTGQLGVATVTLAELYAGAYKHSQVSRLLILGDLSVRHGAMVPSSLLQAARSWQNRQSHGNSVVQGGTGRRPFAMRLMCLGVDASSCSLARSPKGDGG